MKNKQKEQILSASRQDNKLSFWFLEKFLLILILVAPATNCFASDDVAGEYFVNPRKKIEAVIAAGELNRIAIFRGEITEIVGDESKYLTLRKNRKICVNSVKMLNVKIKPDYP